MKKTIFLILLLITSLIIIGLTTLPSKNREERLATIVINNHSFNIEIADTDQARQKGLSGRQKLPRGSGLLFIFPKPDYYSFWMKEMNFPIDIIWLDSDKKIVDIMVN